jgi:hypothetical protein
VKRFFYFYGGKMKKYTRGEFIRLSGLLVTSAVAACDSRLTAPDSVTTPPQPVIDPNITIDATRVGRLVYPAIRNTSQQNLTLLDVAQRAGLTINQTSYSTDRVTGIQINGFGITAINGDLGPEMINVFGEKVNTGWVVGVGDKHIFYNSAMTVVVNPNELIDFYYGLPCHDPFAG